VGGERAPRPKNLLLDEPELFWDKRMGRGPIIPGAERTGFPQNLREGRETNREGITRLLKKKWDNGILGGGG